MKAYLNRISKMTHHQEVENQWTLLYQYLNSTNATPAQLNVTHDYLNDFRSKQAHWCRAWFPNARNLDTRTTGRSEVENKQHKLNDKVHSKTSMVNTVSADYLRAERRTTECVNDTLQSLCHPIIQSISNQTLPTWVYDVLSPYAAKQFHLAWSRSSDCTITQPNSRTYYVTSSADFEEDDKDSLLPPLPRKVYAVVLSDSYLQCHCSLASSNIMICQHLLAIMRALQCSYTMAPYVGEWYVFVYLSSSLQRRISRNSSLRNSPSS